MGTRLVIALILKEGDIRKAPRIQIATLLCIFFNSLREYNSSALL